MVIVYNVIDVTENVLENIRDAIKNKNLQLIEKYTSYQKVTKVIFDCK